MIDFDRIAWNDEDNPRGNVQHIAANGLTLEEVEQVLHDRANRPTVSRSTGRPAVFGATAAGKGILVVYEVLETEPVIVIRPITADEPMPESGACPCTPGAAASWKRCLRKRGPQPKPQSRGPQPAGPHPRAKRNRRREEVIRKVREEFPPLAIDQELAKAFPRWVLNARDRG